MQDLTSLIFRPVQTGVRPGETGVRPVQTGVRPVQSLEEKTAQPTRKSIPC